MISPEPEIRLEAGRRLASCEAGEEIVISGLAGVFPDTDDVRHFGECLMNKVELISDDDRRWKSKHDDIPQRTGKLKVINKFDASFFGVNYKHAVSMDPMARILMEKTYEAIVDAGFNPTEFRGTRTGVFIGVCFAETESLCFTEKMANSSVTGSARALFANRISYWLNVDGPSFTIDSACSSSSYAVEQAYRYIREGHCEQAIVGGCNLCLHPNLTLQFARAGVLSADGRCRCFDESANGYVRSEAVCVLLLQKAKNARRVYARVVHAKISCDGFKEQGITFPSWTMQRKLMDEFYQECQINPSTVDYIEAHGTGTRAGDPEEVKALDAVFCPGRNGPLKIGSVKSNAGHTEGASGVTSIAKAILAMESGFIQPTINFKTPRADIEAIQQGRITVITEPVAWNGGMIGVNSFGFGGSNSHILLASNKNEKINNALPADDIPRLVCASGRTKEAVRVILDELESRPLDVELVRLLHQIHSEEISGHIFRGYTLLRNDRTKIDSSIENYAETKRPIWFVFGGMGSQWPTMGKSLMNIPIFAESIRKSRETLKLKGLDLMEIITSDDPKIFDNALNSFVGIVAIQIGLVDILRELGITPDRIIGHSVGELGCGYIDGVLTAEQTLLASYYRGLATIESKLIHGSMAAVGLGYNALKDNVPSDIDIACHNGPDSCTISGPTESIGKFVESLQSRAIFARRVNSGNIALHGRHIAPAGPKLLTYLKQVIGQPKERSVKWLSTSVPESEWHTEKAKYSSAEYYTNNLLNPVYFEEVIAKIPTNAIVIEIGPHALLQTILKRSLHENVVNIPLTFRGVDSTQFLLTALGKAYAAGVNMKLHKIYPAVAFPVSKGTPMISPLIRWEHSKDLHTYKYNDQSDDFSSGERIVKMSLKDPEFEYLAGHVINNKNLCPATYYLMLAWETISSIRGRTYLEVPIVFENVRFIQAVDIAKEDVVEFTVMVQKGSGNFEVVHAGTAVVSGRLYVPEDVAKEMVNQTDITENLTSRESDFVDELHLNQKDIYKEFRLRNYHYKGIFKSITKCNLEGTVHYVKWADNFVAYIDNMLQTTIISTDSRTLNVPVEIRKLTVDVRKHLAIVEGASPPNGNSELAVHYYKYMDLIRSGGIELRGLRLSPIFRKKTPSGLVLGKFLFVPNVISSTSLMEFTFDEIIRVVVHFAIENSSSSTTEIRTIELSDGTTQQLISTCISNVMADFPLTQTEIIILKTDHHQPLLEDVGNGITVTEKKNLPSDAKALLVVIHDLLSRPQILLTAMNTLVNGGFVLSLENDAELKLPADLYGFNLCLDYTVENKRILLLRKESTASTYEPIVIRITSNTFAWLPEVQKTLKTLSENQKLILYSEAESHSGLLGFFKTLRKEEYTKNIRCFVILDENAPSFNVKHPLYNSQLSKDLVVNIYKNGTWATYRHLPLGIRQNVKSYHSFVNAMVPGNLATLKWIEGPIEPSTFTPEQGQELLYVYYAPLNFRDVMLATGKLSQDVITGNRLERDCVLGLEYAGKTSNGKRYMGITKTKAMSPIVVKEATLSWQVPNDWSLEEASTVPVVYGTVVCGLITSAGMRRGESVLIHAGSGGVGQAAINICLFYGCEIFTTVGTAEKREFIRKTFPQIPESHIGNSRDTSFEQMIMRETNGRGVDIVLNSLAEEKLQASVRCLAVAGRFLEIGKYDLTKNNALGMGFFLKKTSFHAVMLDYLFDADLELKLQLKSDFQRMLDNGAVKPLVRTLFDYHDVESAFRYMASGKHIGKVVLKLRDEQLEHKFAQPEMLRFDAIPRYLCRLDKSYIICGGLGGFGLELADWLVLRGARKIVLSSRNGIKTGYQSMRIRWWRSYGVNVTISLDNIAKKEGVENLLNVANSLGPVSAIFNLAVVIRDGFFNDQTEDTFAIPFEAKSSATNHLDRLSRVMCPELEHFVVFSSLTCDYGNAGQTNYGMANSVAERICESRRANNLPATAIEWGLIDDVGLASEMMANNSHYSHGGVLFQKMSSCLDVMDSLLKQPNTIVSSMVLDEKRSEISRKDTTIVEVVSNIMGFSDLSTVSLNSTLAELGLDSMMAVEIKQVLESKFDVFLSSQDIRNLSFAKLKCMVKSTAIPETTINADEGGGRSVNELQPIEIDHFMNLTIDERHASLPVVRLPSILENGSIVEVPIDKVPTVFMIPGMEGNPVLMESLAANLEMQVLCLQYFLDDPNGTMEQLASSIYSHIRNRLFSGVGQRFYIIGYSYGGTIALEVVKRLEQDGYLGYLCLIDSSPEFVKNTLKQTIYNDQLQSDDEFQIKLLLHYFSPIPSLTVNNEMKESLLKLKNWNDRLDKALSVIPEINARHSKKYQRLLVNDFYLKVKLVFSVEDKPTRILLTTPAILIRPSEIFSQLEDDYGLSKYFKNVVATHFVDGNHRSILKNEETARIISSAFPINSR